MDSGPNNGLERSPEYRRLLAELSPAERRQLLRLDFNLPRELGKKREFRRALSNLPPAEKLRLLEELRIRAQILQGSRRAPSLTTPPAAKQYCPTPPPVNSGQEPTTGADHCLKEDAHRFGGRATASGVHYEARVAAFIAVKMLSGSQCVIWDNVSGTEVSAITMQASEPADDIVVFLRGDPEANVFIAAKERGKSIALTPNSQAFTDTVKAFVLQFRKLSETARPKSRLVWAIPACAGQAVTRELAMVLDTHRMDAGDAPLAEFQRAQPSGNRKALDAFLSVTETEWRKQAGTVPAEEELRSFLRRIYVEIYEFEYGQRFERKAEEDIRRYVVVEPKQARRVWEKLEHFFCRVDQRGVRVTPASLRQVLTADGLRLKSPPDYAEEIGRLTDLTALNLARLKEHTIFPFGPHSANHFHLARTEAVSALVAAAKHGHLLLTGKPGCGKSGLIHALVEALQNDNLPVVLLLAEETFGRGGNETASLPGFTHSLDDILVNWPNGARGFLITDALDAVRDPANQKMLRSFLRDAKQGQSGWTVIASVREFDLKHSRELREFFPGSGVEGHSAKDFVGVAHFQLGGLSEIQLDELAARRPEIRPFIKSARKSSKAGGIHLSPFYLRLAAELLRAGVTPLRLADWNSPAMLLRKFWNARIKEDAGADEREEVVKNICCRMVEERSMTLSLQELSLDGAKRAAIRELRSRGVLQAPALRHGMPVGDEEVQFTHHLLHDYAIARALIPMTGTRFCKFVAQKWFLPIFYRQSVMFALEELWDTDDQRNTFWESALRLESEPELHVITRILAPVLASRRVETFIDLKPLLEAIVPADGADTPAQKALSHLASGLQDANKDAICTGAAGWCEFAGKLSNLLPRRTSIEAPLVHILNRLNEIGGAREPESCLALNTAGRRLLDHHITKEGSKTWPYAARVAIQTLCRTFTAAPAESELALLKLLTPERLAKFPHEDLFELAHGIQHLGANGVAVVLRLFEAAFGVEPQTNQWEQFGSAILPMRIQTGDQWKLIHYALAEYYEARTGENAALMTELACIAWNSVVRRRTAKQERTERILSTIQFRSAECKLVEDYSHIWNREFENEEDRILSHFEKLLREWAAAGDVDRLNAALDRFAMRNCTSLVWTVFLKAGAEHPSTLGLLLEEVLNESLFLTHPDYAYGGTALLGALHKAGDVARRERLEMLILDLPKNARLHEGENRNPIPSWIERARNRLLGALEESKIMLGAVRDLWRERQTAKALAPTHNPEGTRVNFHTPSDEELAEDRGVNLKESGNMEMLRLCEALKPFLDRSNNKLDVKEVERNWPVIGQCQLVLKRHTKRYPTMAEQLQGYLVNACENIVRHATWPKTDERWKTVRRILLEAAHNPVPQADNNEETEEDRWPTWGWPSPRIDAARGLPILVCRLGCADKAIANVLRILCFDKSHPVRFHLANELGNLDQSSPDLMWELIDTFIAHEQKFSVLDALLDSMSRLGASATERARQRLRWIAGRAMKNAPADHTIHETLASIHLFIFLRTGEPECEAFIARLMAECDKQPASNALATQLHHCRQGGWLTAGDGVKPDAQADVVRARTWDFFSKLLASAQCKLHQHHGTWLQLQKQNQTDAEAINQLREKLTEVARLIDAIASQLYFASGAFDEKNNRAKNRLTSAQLRRFWQEAAPLFSALSDKPHPRTACQIVQTLHFLLPCAPKEIFVLAAKTIRNSADAGGFQYEPLAVAEVVNLIQRALADHRDIFQSDHGQANECLEMLLEMLDLFIEAGWAEARQLTHRLEEIYR